MSFKLFPRQRTAPASIPLLSSGALTSLYQVTPRLSLVVTTNADHSQTVIQLPEENGPH